MKRPAATTLTLVLLALGDALMGEALANSLGVARGTARETAERLLVDTLARHLHPEAG